MYNGCITDVKGITAAHATNAQARTGCTVVICKEGATGGVDVRGGAPGTRETDAFAPINMVPAVHAVVLAGGSAYGLAAADGVMRELEKKNIGYDVGVGKVPIVGSAVLFDLANGDMHVRPDAQMGAQAALQAGKAPLKQGLHGAGTGATVGKLYGMEYQSPGGFGCASVQIGPATLAAAVAVNAAGQIVNPVNGQLLQGARDAQGNLLQGPPLVKPLQGTNTTIGLLATDAILTKAQAHRLAMLGHDGYAMAIHPVHTMYDGDTVFALATNQFEVDPDVLFALSAEVMARAIVNAVTRRDA